MSHNICLDKLEKLVGREGENVFAQARSERVLIGEMVEA